MSLNRREMLRLGAAGAGGLLLSSAVGAETLPTPGFVGVQAYVAEEFQSRPTIHAVPSNNHHLN